MEYRFFTIMAIDPDQAAEQLNRCLKQYAVHTVDRQFVSDGANSFWSICVAVSEHEKGGGTGRGGRENRARVDYYAELGPELFAVFDRLRQKRNEIAKSSGVPAYAIFTNDHLAAMCRLPQVSRQALASIEGIGEKRLERYGEAFLALLNSRHDKDHANEL